jgi:prephenate dehydrogenase
MFVDVGKSTHVKKETAAAATAAASTPTSASHVSSMPRIQPRLDAAATSVRPSAPTRASSVQVSVEAAPLRVQSDQKVPTHPMQGTGMKAEAENEVVTGTSFEQRRWFTTSPNGEVTRQRESSC